MGPTRNSAATLRSCLDSIRTQSIPCCPVVVDNDSTDATVAIAEEFSDLVLHPGPERSAQRNMEERLRRRSSVNVEFLGHSSKEEKLSRMASGRALLATTVRDGRGLVVTEAASVGTPAIGYDVPGLGDPIAASGGQLVNPHTEHLAATVIIELPALLRGSRTASPRGAISWKEVADSILDGAPRDSLCRGPDFTRSQDGPVLRVRSAVA